MPVSRKVLLLITVLILLAWIGLRKTTSRDRTDILDRGGPTPLMTAAYHGDLPKVMGLLDQGANPYQVTAEGKNVMDYAVLGGTCQIPMLIALKKRVPDLQLHEPSPIWRNLEVAKLKGCALLTRATSTH